MPDETSFDRAFYYSDLPFFPRYRKGLAAHVLAKIAALEHEGQCEVLGGRSRIRLRYLDWDTKFFGVPFYRLEFPDWDADVDDPKTALAGEIEAARETLGRRHPRYYLFTEVPSADLVYVQALGLARARLIETRALFYFDGIARFSRKRRYNVRVPDEGDIENLRDVAARSVNRYDRFHADDFFGAEEAARYLAIYAENSVRGLADFVLVPDIPFADPGAFVTVKYIAEAPSTIGVKATRGGLSAVSKSRSGWMHKLSCEMLLLLRENGVDIVTSPAATSNMPVIRVFQSLDFKFGGTMHVFSI